MNKFIFIFITSILLSGCYDAPNALKPMPWIFKQMPKDAPNNYKRGWIDGCESGLGNMTNAMYKTFYTFKQDKKLREDATYYSTWKTSFNFCRHYAYGTLRQSNQRMVLPNKRSEFQEWFMGADGGVLSDSSALHLWGPGDWLLPFQKIGPIGGDGYMPAPGTHDPGAPVEKTGIVGQSELDFSDGFEKLGIGYQNGSGMTMDFQTGVPFFEQ